MKVYLFRHGIAAPYTLGHMGDHGRPLTDAGRRQLARTGVALRRMDIRPDILASSPLVRATQTADIVSRYVGTDVSIWDALKPERSPAEALDRIRRSGADSVMVVGHEPHLTDMISAMISDCRVSISLKKGAMAYVRLGAPQPATLRYILTPRQMGMIS